MLAPQINSQSLQVLQTLCAHVEKVKDATSLHGLILWRKRSPIAFSAHQHSMNLDFILGFNSSNNKNQSAYMLHQVACHHCCESLHLPVPLAGELRSMCCRRCLQAWSPNGPH